MRILITSLFFLFMAYSCDDEKIYVPKPRSYPKIEFPAKKYQLFDKAYCDLEFQFPSYAKITKDELVNNDRDKPVHACWFDIDIPSLNGKVHCNYNRIQGRASFDKLIQDAYTMAGKHNVKADYYKETAIHYPNNVSGIVFEIEGEVATPIQFYLTDSVNHFFRGSLYFNNQVNIDSMIPVYEFVKTDIDKLIESFRWK